MRLMLIGLGALFAAGCAPTPVRMAPEQARAAIEQFAAGTQEFDVCTDEGRAVLRGAVQAFSAAEAAEGRVWPTVPVGDERAPLDAINGSVLVAVAAGFVQVNDLRGEARGQYRLMALDHWLDMRDARLATRLACDDMLRFQQVGSRLVMEMQRYRRMQGRGRVSSSRLFRQGERVRALEEEFRQVQERIQTRMLQHRAEQKR